MANALYTTYKNVLLGSGTYTVPDLNSDTIKALLIFSTYSVNLAGDVYLSDISSGYRAASAQTITVSSITGGAAIVSSTVTFPSVTTSATAIDFVVIYKHTGTESTSALIAYYDTFASGIPVTPSGSNIDVNFDSSGIVQL